MPTPSPSVSSCCYPPSGILTLRKSSACTHAAVSFWGLWRKNCTKCTSCWMQITISLEDKWRDKRRGSEYSRPPSCRWCGAMRPKWQNSTTRLSCWRTLCNTTHLRPVSSSKCRKRMTSMTPSPPSPSCKSTSASSRWSKPQLPSSLGPPPPEIS